MEIRLWIKKNKLYILEKNYLKVVKKGGFPQVL